MLFEEVLTAMLQDKATAAPAEVVATATNGTPADGIHAGDPDTHTNNVCWIDLVRKVSAMSVSRKSRDALTVHTSFHRVALPARDHLD